MSDSQSHATENRRDRNLLIIAILLLPAPVLFLKYLPMTDLPQHLAMVAIIDRIDDPEYGFDEHHEVDMGRTLYLSPYFAARALGKVMPLEVAMRCVVYVSIVLFPLGLVAMLRAMGKPLLLGWFALPLSFHHFVFWGFLAFNLSLGIACLACALLMRPQRTLGTDLGVAALCAAVAVTHLFGVAVILGFVFLWFVVGQRRELLRRLPSVAPAAIGAAIWLSNIGSGRSAPSPIMANVPLWIRAVMFGEHVNGGFWFSLVFLIAYMVIVISLLWGSFPRSRERWHRLTHFERVMYAYIAVNLVLYCILPFEIAGIHNVYNRHALLIAAMLPLVVPVGRIVFPARRLRFALLTLATGIFISNWAGLFAFNYEARGFDAVVEKLPPKSRLLTLTYDKDGKYLRTHPYMHFPGYAQTAKGGILSYSFARHLHHLPVFQREDSLAPVSPFMLEWRPSMYSYADFGYFYDYVLIRTADGYQPPLEQTETGETMLLRTDDDQNDLLTRLLGRERKIELLNEVFNENRQPRPPDAFPFELIHHDTNWWLYRKKVTSPH